MSVLNQDYGNLEFIVMDGASTDRTFEIIKKYEKYLAYWVSKPDRGQWDALNEGFKVSSGEIVAWLNSDDIFLPDAFNRFVSAYRENWEGDIFYGDYLFIDEKDNILKKRIETGYTARMLLYIGCYIPSSGSFFKRAIFTEGYYVSPLFSVALDYEFLFRLSKAGKKFVHIKKYLSGFRRHGKNKSLSRNAAIEEGKIRLMYGPKLFKAEAWNLRIYQMMKYLYLVKRGVIKSLRGGYF